MQLIKRLQAVPTSVFLAGTLAVGAVVRFWHIATSSIWHDEGYTMMLAPQPVHDILLRTGRDVHPPLYYIKLHYWMQIFGNSETAARGLSAVLSLATIVVVYLLVKRLFSEPTARLAAVFSALAPFLVRYSQEARMYAMVAFLLALATYFLVRALESRRWIWWAGYSLAIAAALYTHYYSVFMILTHWVWITSQTKKPNHGLLDKQWWIANVGAAALFAPWLPTAYHQFSRVQASFWIPKVNIYTLPNTLSQFTVFTDGYGRDLKFLAAGLFAALVASALVAAKKQRVGVLLLTLYALVGPVCVFLLSYKRPIYIDRYFVFAAVAFYALLAVGVMLAWPLNKSKFLRSVVIVGLIGAFVFGIRNVYLQSNHQMRIIGNIVSQQAQPGDQVVSGELYTYFDFTYYNHTGQLLKLLAPSGVNGFGESSLLYDRADQIVVRDYKDMHPASGHVWVIGKTGDHDYFTKVPATWQAIGPHYTAGYCAAQEYQILPTSHLALQ